MSRLRIGLAAVAATGLMLFGAGSPAAAGDSAQAVGRVTVFANPDFTGQQVAISYLSCQQASSRLLRQVGSYDNRALAGCQLVLRNSGGAEHVMCAGRAVVPASFRQGTRLIHRPGPSRPCGPIIVTA